ncbi:hypothetical protein PoB_005003200 [Plakobranchus ocellatus]|uniref:Uncharacterized protein n=1 Tax=Plakobranchus ocellatus TaxID=259542 RepID=A0AAV4BWI5_9GAST|nr:hypothetical protein PoB_005003200 [Plakobranchus ocellatus]
MDYTLLNSQLQWLTPVSIGDLRLSGLRHATVTVRSELATERPLQVLANMPPTPFSKKASSTISRNNENRIDITTFFHLDTTSVADISTHKPSSLPPARPVCWSVLLFAVHGLWLWLSVSAFLPWPLSPLILHMGTSS